MTSTRCTAVCFLLAISACSPAPSFSDAGSVDATSPTDASVDAASADAARMDSAVIDAALDDAALDDAALEDAFVSEDASAAPDAFIAPDAFVAPRDASSGSRCTELAQFGACVTRRVSDGAVTTCTEFALAGDYPSDVIVAGCPVTSATLVRTWMAGGACPHPTSVGGCRVISESAPFYCHSQIDWYYPPTDASAQRTACEAAGRTWIAP